MKSGVYIELDALLDTRLATVSRINEQAAVELIKGSEYFARKIDDFEALTGITQAQFREAYAARDVETLKQARITGIAPIFKDLISKLELDATQSPLVGELFIHLNVWPYRLTEEETNVMTSAVMAWAGVETLVSVVRWNPAAITPVYIRREYCAMILYNLRDWFQHHVKALAATPLARVTVFAPALFHDEVPKPEEYLDEGMRPDVCPFELTEVGLVEYLGLELLGADHFSFYRPA